MLVIDDYKELISLETFLRRLGFDVLSLGKDILVSDALLRFHPEVVIATAKGRAVDGFKVAARVRKQSPPPRVALTYGVGSAPSLSSENQTMIDALVAMPLHATNFIKVIAQLGNLDATPLLAKFQKLATKTLADGSTVDSAGESKFVTGAGSSGETAQYVQSSQYGSQSGSHSSQAEWDPKKTPGQASTLRSARSDRYDRFLHDHDDGEINGVLPREKAQAAMRQLKKDAEKDKPELDRINEEKMAFTKALFEEDED